MEITQTTVDKFITGNGTADATAKPIVAAGVVRKCYKGVTVRCTTGTVYVGPYNVSDENGFELPAGTELLVPVEDPSKVYIVAPAGGTYSWLAV